MKIQIGKFASVTSPFKLSTPVEVARNGAAEAGQLVVVRALTENPLYPDIELVGGDRVPIRKGDVIAAVLGSRQALRGFVGYAPYRIASGDKLHILNLGGVVGRFVGGHKDLGEPVQVEVLGISRRNLREVALPKVDVLAQAKPIILVCGSCMHVGKTAATEELIKGLTWQGLKVGGAKITGIACLKDTIRMKNAGAVRTLSFLDCGVPSTVDTDDIAGIARSIVSEMNDVDVVVMELGDGIMGHYKVDRFFDDRALMSHIDAVVFCASDLTAAWGGKEILAQRGIPVTVVCGPATDTEAGVTYLEKTLGVPAANALTDSQKLLNLMSPVLTQ
ncbi:MAG TPA: hypothetical protein VEN81_03730 [Planctomycetota bacterium]|nr:hypothetical protein [Planctomycetota bacterium]